MVETVDPVQLQKLRRLAQIKRDNGLAFYRPHAKQELFHAAGAFKRRYVRTGNRFGKSTCGASEDLAWAIGERIWYPQGDPRRTAGIPKRSTKGLIIVADWDKAREQFTNQQEGAAMGKLFKLMPKAAFKGVHKNQAGEVDMVMVQSIHGGISSIYLDTVKSFASNPMGQESSDWDWIHVDEPCPKDMWVANSRGLVDRGGSAWFTCTPITQPWINEYFIPRHRQRDEFGDGLGDEAASKWVMTGTMMDNPILPRESIEMFSNDMSPAERESRIYGRPKSLNGVIYKSFDRERHVYHDVPKGWNDFDDPPRNYCVRYAIDPHPRTPHAVLFAATAPTGEVFFYKEIFDPCYIETLADNILITLDGRVPVTELCDLSAFNVNPIDGGCWADIFWRKGLGVGPASKELTAGIVRVEQELSRPNNLYFSSALNETLSEFDSYSWDPKKEKPVDKNDHMMECLYRLVVNGLHYINPIDPPTKPDKGLILDKLDLSLPFNYKRDKIYG